MCSSGGRQTVNISGDDTNLLFNRLRQTTIKQSFHINNLAMKLMT